MQREEAKKEDEVGRLHRRLYHVRVGMVMHLVPVCRDSDQSEAAMQQCRSERVRNNTGTRRRRNRSPLCLSPLSPFSLFFCSSDRDDAAALPFRTRSTRGSFGRRVCDSAVWLQRVGVAVARWTCASWARRTRSAPAAATAAARRRRRARTACPERGHWSIRHRAGTTADRREQRRERRRRQRGRPAAAPSARAHAEGTRSRGGAATTARWDYRWITNNETATTCKTTLSSAVRSIDFAWQKAKSNALRAALCVCVLLLS